MDWLSQHEENLLTASKEDCIEFSIYNNLPITHHVLEAQRNCSYCRAKRLQYEFPTFCCMNGKVEFAHPTIPDELYNLFMSNYRDSTQFKNDIRKYNNHFFFTSMGIKLDKDSASMRGVYTFRLQGQIYHTLDQLVPKEDGPKYMQLYFYDTDYDVDHRLQRTSYLDINSVQKLVRILSTNPYVKVFRSLGEFETLENFRITLNTNVELDQRVYTTPTT